jgi:hypothetical protein
MVSSLHQLWRVMKMMCVEEKTALLDEFSHQVRRHFPADVWRSLFQDRTGKAQFGTTTRTLLCVECPESGPLKREGVMAALSRLVQLHGGCVDPCIDGFAFVSASRPEQVLRVALALQRLAGRARLRMGVLTARCNVVRGEAGGQDILMLLGAQRARVQSLAHRASAGTVQMSPETYDAIGGAVSDELGSCVVMAEFDGDVLKEITVTVPPDASSDVSTFAGLGLT